MKPAEAATIATMQKAGFTIQDIAKAVGRTPQTVISHLKSAREFLESQATEYARLHMEATKTAAKDGNSKPAEWALERLRIVEPAQTAAGNGFTVNIGVALPGLGTRPEIPMTVTEIPVTIDSEDVTES